MTDIFTPVKDLPNSVKSTLLLVGYRKADIRVVASEKVSVGQGGGEGRRSFYTIVALDGSAASKVSYGSWGGANPHEAKRADLDYNSHPITPGYVVITGSESGGTKVYASMHVHPSNMAALLPLKTDLTDRNLATLKLFKEYTSSGRKSHWVDYPETCPTQEEIDYLVSEGYLKQNKNGALSITTKGKNAR